MSARTRGRKSRMVEEAKHFADYQTDWVWNTTRPGYVVCFGRYCLGNQIAPIGVVAFECPADACQCHMGQRGGDDVGRPVYM